MTILHPGQLCPCWASSHHGSCPSVVFVLIPNKPLNTIFNVFTCKIHFREAERFHWELGIPLGFLWEEHFRSALGFNQCFLYLEFLHKTTTPHAFLDIKPTKKHLKKILLAKSEQFFGVCKPPCPSQSFGCCSRGAPGPKICVLMTCSGFRILHPGQGSMCSLQPPAAAFPQ